MREWEQLSASEFFDTPQYESPRLGLFGQYHRTIYKSGRYIHPVVEGEPAQDGSSQVLEVGKILVLKNGVVDTIHYFEDPDLVEVLQRRDPPTLFQQTILNVIDKYEIDQEMVDSVLALTEYLKLNVVAAAMRYKDPKTKSVRTELAFPIALAGATNIPRAIKIAAVFMKITRASEALTEIREEIFKPRCQS